MPTKSDLIPPLIGGPYAAPRCRPGRLLACLLRGDVPVDGITDAPIPWPYTKYRGDGITRSGKPMLIVTPELERAIRTESNRAIAYHWGVTSSTVFLWRKKLGVPSMTPGTLRLLSDHAHAKLTKLAPKVPAIRAAITEGKTNQEISRELKIDWRTVRKIRRGLTFAGWGWPDGPIT